MIFNTISGVSLTKFEKIDEQTIKIVLTVKDMSDYDLTYEQMDYNDQTTRKAILKIIQKIQGKTGVSVESSKLFIETFPSTDGGCIMYINLLTPAEEQSYPQKRKQSFDTPLIFEVNTIDTVVDMAKRLFKKQNHLIINSALYLFENRYHLFIYSYCRMEKRIITIAEEYGTYLGKGAVLAAVTREHAKEITSDHAIETLLYYLE